MIAHYSLFLKQKFKGVERIALYISPIRTKDFWPCISSKEWAPTTPFLKCVELCFAFGGTPKGPKGRCANGSGHPQVTSVHTPEAVPPLPSQLAWLLVQSTIRTWRRLSGHYHPAEEETRTIELDSILSLKSARPW